MKKKSLVLLFLSLAAVSLAFFLSVNLLSDAKENDNSAAESLPEDAVSITGTVEQVEGNRILINSQEGGLLYLTVTDSTEIYSGSRAASITEIKVGGQLTVAHNGIVLKSHPGQINIVYRIDILEAK